MTESIERAAGAPVTAICRNRIEEEIIRAYVRLACAPDQANNVRTQTIAQTGALEIRMTESLLGQIQPLVPPFRIEIHSHESGTVLASGDYFEFDEDELRAAIELIVSARVSQFAPH